MPLPRTPSPGGQSPLQHYASQNSLRNPLAEINSPNQLGKRAYSRQLSRDERIKIRALHEYGHFTYSEIASRTGFTQRQVQRAVTGPPTPQKPRVIPSKYKLNEEARQQLRDFLANEQEISRKVAWNDLRYLIPGFEIYGDRAIHTALKDMGYQRRKRHKSLRLTASTRAKRRDFCSEWLEKLGEDPDTWEQHFDMAFSDETWANTGTPKWAQWITIHSLEDPENWKVIRQKGHGWMFWGCFSGLRKGPCYIWPKEYGGIDQHKYQEHVVPLIQRWYEELGAFGQMPFVQDGAPGHRARSTKLAMERLGIPLVKWPPYSPDLNLIENIWIWMKRWLDERFDMENLTEWALHEAIFQAWDAVPTELLRALVRSMPRRMKQCLERDGGKTDF
jgi:transposase